MNPSLSIDLSVVIPALNEAENLRQVIPQIRAILQQMELQFEVLVVDEKADEATREVIAANRVTLLSPDTHGYGHALEAGLRQSQGRYVVTMDADLSHPPEFLRALWNARHTADVVIASRYVPGGRAEMPAGRYILSKILNIFFSRGLDLKVRDMSSGFRLYTRQAIPRQPLASQDFNVLQELLVKTLAEGFRIHEVPFTYLPRRSGSSHARVFKFGLAYLRTFGQLWRLRNSIASADYDTRAYHSWVPPQRYWQRQRYKHMRDLAKGVQRVLDVGCGSSRIMEILPPGSVGLDILVRKLRFSRRYKPDLVQGSVLGLPVASQSFPCVLCSQVIEHVPRENTLDELDRVLQPGGLLILGTPDYSKWQWIWIEWLYGKLLPQAYADEHITHYSYKQLVDEFVLQRGYTLLDCRYILQGEMILSMQKPGKVE